MSIYDYEYTSIEGKTVQMSEYRGKVLLIVNTASKCGFTPQFEGLQELYAQYHDQGLEIIGFPCNQFQEQEPNSEEEIAKLCSVRYGVTFPLSSKVDVRDETAIPLYKYLTGQKKYTGLGKGVKAKSFELFLKRKYKKDYKDDQIKWNFTKFLVDREGNIAGRFEPPVEPQEMKKDIEGLL